MTDYRYLIIGGVVTADEAARAVRAADRTGRLGIISTEINPPYNRPPLSKDLWKDTPVEAVWRKTDTLELDMHLGREAQTIGEQLDKLNDQIKELAGKADEATADVKAEYQAEIRDLEKSARRD